MEDKVRRWRGSCEDCFHWKFHDDGGGHCSIYSASCAASIARKNIPTRFLSRFDVPVKDGGSAGEEEEA